MKYGYARVSSLTQLDNGNGLEAQVAKLKEAGCDVIYSEQFTGTKTHRPEFDKLMAVLQSGDMLVVTKLDRIARSTRGGLALADDLIGRGVTINILNLGVLDNTPSGKLIRAVFFAFAEFERDMIVERTQEGKEIARKKPGYREGRKPIAIDPSVISSAVQTLADGKSTVKSICSDLGISRSSWYKLTRNSL